MVAFHKDIFACVLPEIACDGYVLSTWALTQGHYVA